MSENNMIGNENGVALWNLMSSTEDVLERDYFVRLNSAASKFGTVWFTDTITQRETNKNQTTWQLTWHADRATWEVTKFHIPEGVKEATSRIDNHRNQPEELIELSLDDLIIEE